MISYCITVYDEILYIKNLIGTILSFIKEDEEIVVVQTHRNISNINEEYYKDIKNFLISNNRIIYDTFEFNDKFHELKNYVGSLAKKPYILNLDADEIIGTDTIQIIRQTIIENPEIDLFYLPRINIVNGLTQEDIDKWSWKVNEYQWVNWPDYQPRLYKNLTNIHWVGDVHEYITGYKHQGVFPQHPDCAIVHDKSIDRQRIQNELYDTIILNKEEKKPISISNCRVLIGMCSWNSPQMLKKCIDSILPHINLSIDKIAVVLNQGDLESIKYLHNLNIPFVFNPENSGPLGIDYLKPFIENSEYFLNSNDDMIFHKGFIEDLISIIEVNYPCTASCGLVENFFSNNPPVVVDTDLKDFDEASIQLFLDRQKEGKYEKPFKIISYTHPIMVKSKDLLDLGGYSGNWNKDFLSGYGRDDAFPFLLWKNSDTKYKFIVSNQSVVFHLSSATNKKLSPEYRAENHNQDKFMKISNGISLEQWRSMINFGNKI